MVTQLWKAAAQTSTDPCDGQTECTAEAEGEDCPDCAERGHGYQPTHGAHPTARHRAYGEPSPARSFIAASLSHPEHCSFTNLGTVTSGDEYREDSKSLKIICESNRF